MLTHKTDDHSLPLSSPEWWQMVSMCPESFSVCAPLALPHGILRTARLSRDPSGAGLGPAHSGNLLFIHSSRVFLSPLSHFPLSSPCALGGTY